MTKKPTQDDSKFSMALKRDLAALYHDQHPIPEAIDRKILQHARQQLGTRPRRRFLRWALSAAAVFILSIGNLAIWMNRSRSPQGDMTASVLTAADLDQNGTVNILDAFWLARRLQDSDTVQSHWDLNTDGQVNQADIHLVAQLAVRLDLKEVL